MASPLAHTTIAYAIHKLMQPVQAPETGSKDPSRSALHPPTLLQSIILSNLPDLDALLGLLFKDMKRFHNNISHSLLTGLVLSLLVALRPLTTDRRPQTADNQARPSKPPSASHVFLHYTLHLLTDLLSYNKRGLMLFAPISKRRFQLPITLFYGLRWGSGLFSVKHLWTLATELLFSLVVIQTLKIFRKVSSVT